MTLPDEITIQTNKGNGAPYHGYEGGEGVVYVPKSQCSTDMGAVSELCYTLEKWIDLAERHLDDFCIKMDANRAADFHQGISETKLELAKARGLILPHE